MPPRAPWSRGFEPCRPSLRFVWGSASRPGDRPREVAQFADGVIVGSALVRCLLDSPDAAGVAALARLTADLADGVRVTAG